MPDLDEHQPLLDQTLRAAFGRTAAATRIGGITATVYRVELDAPYVVRIGANPHVDPAFELAATRTAADAGLAPPVLYADVANRVLVTPYIAPVPYPADIAAQVARSIARLHTLPPWPRTIHHHAMTDRFVDKLPEPFADVVAAYREVTANYSRDLDLVACHNDLKAPNILFDGTRPWIIDWEAAFMNERYADLANAATFFVDEEPVAETAYLTAYFDRPPNPAESARFAVARFVNHVAYIGLLVPPVETIAPDFRAFHAGIADGTVDLNAKVARDAYGAVHLAAARSAMRRM
jgi:Ser/Thr protein kinase RdoA (MazF antagonist)